MIYYDGQSHKPQTLKGPWLKTRYDAMYPSLQESHRRQASIGQRQDQLCE